MNLGIALLAFAVGGAFGVVITALLVAHGQRERAAQERAESIEVTVE